MSGYMPATETVNTQFLNSSFVDKVIDKGLVKEASDSMTFMVRQRLREDSFLRKVLPPVIVTQNDLDRQLTEEPTIILDKEPDSTAVDVPFLGRPEMRYFKTNRFPVTFSKIVSEEFKKSKIELMSSRTDVRTVLQENSAKDIQEAEDNTFYNNILQIAEDNGNVYNIAGGFNRVNLTKGINKMIEKRLPVGCILMTQSMYNDLSSLPATDIGSTAASGIFLGQEPLVNPMGYKYIITNKNNILPTNQAIVFTPPQYLGMCGLLQDTTTFLKVEGDIISFYLYEYIGVGIGNVNGAVVLNF